MFVKMKEVVNKEEDFNKSKQTETKKGWWSKGFGNKVAYPSLLESCTSCFMAEK